MEPKIVSKPAFIIVGMKHSGTNSEGEIPKLWGQFGPRMCEIKHAVEPEVSYGLVTSFDPESKVFDYIAGVQVSNTEEMPEGMVSWEVPAQKYAVFTWTLPGYAEAYKQASETWLPASGYQRASMIEFERYDGDFDPEDPTSELEFYLPIE